MAYVYWWYRRVDGLQERLQNVLQFLETQNEVCTPALSMIYVCSNHEHDT